MPKLASDVRFTGFAKFDAAQLAKWRKAVGGKPGDELQRQVTVVKAWDTARRSLLAPARPFRALSYDALRVLVPSELRERYRLDVSRSAP